MFGGMVDCLTDVIVASVDDVLSVMLSVVILVFGDFERRGVTVMKALGVGVEHDKWFSSVALKRIEKIVEKTAL